MNCIKVFASRNTAVAVSMLAAVAVALAAGHARAQERYPAKPVKFIISQTAGSGGDAPLDFVCEEDVRLAILAGRKIVVSERAIVTPSARDLAEEHRVLTPAPWPRS